MRIPILRRVLFALALLAAGPVAAQGDPSFNLVNRSGQVINEIYVSSAQDSAWGTDLLGTNVLGDRLSFMVRLPPGQCVNDIRVVFAGGRAEERRAVETCSITEVVFGANPQAGTQAGKGGSAASGRTGNPSFNIVNRTGKTINIVRASPASESSWGEDRLGDAVIPPGGTFAIRLPNGECSWDVRIEYADNTAEERRALDLCAVSTLTFP